MSRTRWGRTSVPSLGTRTPSDKGFVPVEHIERLPENIRGREVVLSGRRRAGVVAGDPGSGVPVRSPLVCRHTLLPFLGLMPLGVGGRSGRGRRREGSTVPGTRRGTSLVPVHSRSPRVFDNVLVLPPSGPPFRAEDRRDTGEGKEIYGRDGGRYHPTGPPRLAPTGTEETPRVGDLHGLRPK